MAVYSMTGYASAQSHGTDSGWQLNVEIRAVNGRFLDLVFRLPDELRQAEPALRELLSSQLKRGKIEVRVALDKPASADLRAPSVAVLQQLAVLQQTVQAQLPGVQPFSVMDVLRLAPSTLPRLENPDEELLKLVRSALTALLAARAREGAKLTQMLLDCTAQLRALTQRLVPMVPQLVEQQKVRFLERWQEALDVADGAIAPAAAQERALSESTAFAIRIDVAEEITRLSSHLDEVDRLLAAGGEVGKRLDFLTQELHREANTLGSKSAALELTRIAVDMKVLVEQIREQVQNIE